MNVKEDPKLDLTQAIMEAVAASNRAATKNFADMFNCTNSNDSNNIEHDVDTSEYETTMNYSFLLVAHLERHLNLRPIYYPTIFVQFVCS